MNSIFGDYAFSSLKNGSCFAFLEIFTETNAYFLSQACTIDVDFSLKIVYNKIVFF